VLSPAVFETAAVDRAWLPQHCYQDVGQKVNLSLFYIDIGPMKIRVKLIPQNTIQEVDIKKGSTVIDLLRTIHRRPDSVIVLKNKTPLPVDDVIPDDQELSIIQVASGG
jgi:sulfur carrier protein ThiS